MPDAAGWGGLPKINTSGVLHSQPHSFHLWPMTTACCGLLLSAVHNVVSASPQQLFAVFFCWRYTFWHSFLRSFFLVDTFGLRGVLLHFTARSLCFCLAVSIPLLNRSSSLASALPLTQPASQQCQATGVASYDFVLITCCLIFKATHFHRDGQCIYVIRGWLCCCWWRQLLEGLKLTCHQRLQWWTIFAEWTTEQVYSCPSKPACAFLSGQVITYQHYKPVKR